MDAIPAFSCSAFPTVHCHSAAWFALSLLIVCILPGLQCCCQFCPLCLCLQPASLCPPGTWQGGGMPLALANQICKNYWLFYISGCSKESMGKQLSMSHTPSCWALTSPTRPWIISVWVSSLTAGSLCCLWPECCVEPHFCLYSSELQDVSWERSEKKNLLPILWGLHKHGDSHAGRAVLAARLHTREADRIQSVPVGPMAASPEDLMLQKLLASAVPAVVQNKGFEGNGELQPCSCRAVPYGARPVLGEKGTENFSASPSLPQQI